MSVPPYVYCEHCPGCLAVEPVNAATSLAFIAAGLWLVRRGRIGWGLGLGFVGLASGAWHSLQAPALAFLDAAAVAIYTGALLTASLRRHHNLGRKLSLAALLGIGLASLLAGLAAPDLPPNRGAPLLPPLGYSLATAAVLLRRDRPAGRRVLAAALLLAVALVMRSLDLALCGALPWGTHFLWHILAAIGLALFVLSLPDTQSS